MKKPNNHCRRGIGKVYSFSTAFGHGGPEGWSVDGHDSWFFNKEQAFIGAMGDLAFIKQICCVIYLVKNLWKSLDSLKQTRKKIQMLMIMPFVF